MRILVLRGGALGDLIVTLPLLARLRARWPDARIELAGNATAAVLAQERGLVDAVHSQHESRWAALYGSTPLPDPLAATLAAFDLVMNFWPDPDRELGRHLPVRPGQQFVSASAVPAMSPAAAHFCAPLEQLGVRGAGFSVALRPPRPESGLIAIHPGSGSSRKNWPLERWRELARALARDSAVRLRIVSGEAEAPGLLAEFGEPWRNLPLPSLANELARCELFLGHDSGVSHLAAACGARCLLLFGPTDPAVWAPPGQNVSVLRSGPEVSALSVTDVLQAVNAARRDRS